MCNLVKISQKYGTKYADKKVKFCPNNDLQQQQTLRYINFVFFCRVDCSVFHLDDWLLPILQWRTDCSIVNRNSLKSTYIIETKMTRYCLISRALFFYKPHF